MSLPDNAPLNALSLAEQQELVGMLLTKVAEPKTESQVLRDAVARLKGLPPLPPSRPSGMEKALPGGLAIVAALAADTIVRLTLARLPAAGA